MGGIDPTVITHRLNVSPSFKRVRQKRKSFIPERQKAINEEVGKLLQANAIRDVEYPEWLANVVLIKKENGKWRLCIDFTYINRACPKDSFYLPQIDLMVDAIADHELLSFMDAFSGYNQISMDPTDQDKTSFVTGHVTPGGARDWIGTLYLVYQTLVCPSLITVSTYCIQKYKIKLAL